MVMPIVPRLSKFLSESFECQDLPILSARVPGISVLSVL